MKGGSGNSISELAKLPDEQLDRVTSLLKSAGDLAAKAINAGSAASADLQLLGELSDRCGRAFGRLGLARIPREVGALPLPYTSAPQAQVWSPLRDAIARDTQDAQPVDADALEPIDVSSEAAP